MVFFNLFNIDFILLIFEDTSSMVFPLKVTFFVSMILLKCSFILFNVSSFILNAYLNNSSFLILSKKIYCSTFNCF